MKKSLNKQVKMYQELLHAGDIEIAYVALRKFVSTLRAGCAKKFPQYTVGSVFPSYMDYTYFYFYDDFLKEHKLRFGLVLNHQKMRFELWLLGQNEKVQANYWTLLKDSQWNKQLTERPIYSVLEVVLVEAPNFDELAQLEEMILQQTANYTKKIEHYLQQLEC